MRAPRQQPLGYINATPPIPSTALGGRQRCGRPDHRAQPSRRPLAPGLNRSPWPRRCHAPRPPPRSSPRPNPPSWRPRAVPDKPGSGPTPNSTSPSRTSPELAAFGVWIQTESTLSVGQKFELGGKRTARQRAAEAETQATRVRLAVARADLLNDVRIAYAEAYADGRRVDLARDQFVRAENLQTIATELVDAGREPPLRALRARTAALEAVGRVRAAEAEYAQAQRALAALWGGVEDLPEPQAPLVEAAPVVAIDPADSLDVRLAEAEVASSVAIFNRERASSRPDVTLSVGARQFRGTDDTAVVFGASMPIGGVRPQPGQYRRRQR